MTDLKFYKENIEDVGISDAKGMDFKIYRGNLKLGIISVFNIDLKG